MPLSLYNTLTRHQEPFEPLEPGHVKMYCCGVTVYDYCHLGHARSYIVWDVVRRYLQWSGYQVRYVQNFTDIDDKILNRARQENSTMQAVSDRFIQAYHEDMQRLNILLADVYPKATDVIPEIIQLIQTLVDQGYAYAVDGDVYYAVDRFPDYGKLSGRQLEQMQAGASGRVDDTEPKKRHPLDFALWKAAKSEELSVYQPWDSPWGKGRPGWHIECSAMVRKELGHTIDIHCGGMDLIFPHHENEIAQSEAATRADLAHYWLHNGFVNIQGEKMSKSLGNFKTIRAFLNSGVDPMMLRLFVLQAHYRKPIDFSDETITAAQHSWQTLQEGLRFGYDYGQQLRWEDYQDSSFGDPACMRIPDSGAEIERFRAAMDDDLNTASAIAVLFELAKELRREGNLISHAGQPQLDPQELRSIWQTLVCLAQVLGLEVSPETEVTADDGLSEAEIEDLIQQRQAARKAKNYAEGDRIRNELKTKGITLIDQKDGSTKWIRD
uniref:Cysteine--tRNA ligase n=1 Tax=Cyanothece sp. (strain PCC 7425 / ATCC 29141) TaxID=395961 RepID=SYC_CYAP4|nr:RecName: Full=Cysteine--tRNA ligase; AltName: Full=Cysteinyl-tRNA synthetase; Short=CysRS [Cyanothece sp. PCC 7425]